MAMEKLNAKELENLKKLSDIRQVSNLVKAGLSQDELDTMDRSAMLNRWAELVVAGAGKPATATVLNMLHGISLNLTLFHGSLKRTKTTCNSKINFCGPI